MHGVDKLVYIAYIGLYKFILFLGHVQQAIRLVQRYKTHLKHDEGLWKGHVTLLHIQQGTCKCNKTHRTLTHSNKVGSLGYIVKHQENTLSHRQSQDL